jgi:hypothetical protein
MKGYLLFFFALIPIVGMMFYSGFTYFIGAGWHTELLNEQSLTTYLIVSFLISMTLSYWVINKKAQRTLDVLTITHFIMTVLGIYGVLFGFQLLYFLKGKGLNNMVGMAHLFAQLYPILSVIFLAGQLLGIVNFGIGLKKLIFSKTEKRS